MTLRLAGERFGRLTVLQPSGRNADGAITWECLCDCGNKAVVVGKNMKSGNTTSCGCRKKEALATSRLVDYVGMRFGRLTVTGYAGKTASGIKRLLCRCDYGGERVAPQNSLTGGKTVSCGCASTRKGRKPLMPSKALEYSAARGAIRRASITGSGGRFTAGEIDRLRESQRGKCAYCRADLRNGFHRDHIQPISLGGSSSIDNIQLLCPACNQRKGAKDPIEFAQQVGLLL